jgi:hypothetical protein
MQMFQKMLGKVLNSVISKLKVQNDSLRDYLFTIYHFHLYIMDYIKKMHNPNVLDPNKF